MVSDAKKTKRQRSAAAQDASSEPKPKKAKAAKATKSSTLTQAAAQAVPVAAQAATSRQAVITKKPSTPAAAAVQAAAQVATSRQVAELKALLARLRKPNGLVMKDRELDHTCTKLGLGPEGSKLVKLKRVRKCVTTVTLALEDAFIQERISQNTTTLEKARKAKKKIAKPRTQAKELQTPAEMKDSPTPAVLANTERQTTSDTTAATTQDEVELAQGTTALGTTKERRSIDTSPDKKPSAWFPAPDCSNIVDDEDAFENVMRHQDKFTMADALKIYGELPPPDFRAALGPLADLRRTSVDFPFQIPGPPVDENEGMTLGATSQQE